MIPKRLLVFSLHLLLAGQSPSPSTPFPLTLDHRPTPAFHLQETMPGGLATLDYDSDGRLDILLTRAASPPALYRNTPAGWLDTTAQSGLTSTAYTMAASSADFNNDGHPDLVITSTSGIQLFENRSGRFTDITSRAGIPANLGWVIGAGWFDYDRDGHLDLFLVRYVQYNPAAEPFCGAPDRKYRTYCHPRFYSPLSNVLLHNNGNNTFTDVSKSSGIANHPGKGMAVAFGDADGDGWLDAFVTNDTTPNFLFRNRHDGTFEEVAANSGVAWNDDGLALSSMGTDFRDINGDGREDIFLTALANEAFPAYLALGKGQFEDASYRLGIAGQLLPYAGWATGIYDFDNDGQREIFVATGDVQTNTELFSSRKSKQPSLLLRRGKNNLFAATPISEPAWHRGAAFADFQNNGCIAALVSRLGESPFLYSPTCPKDNHWLGITLIGTRNNRQGLGALITLTTSQGTQINRATTSVGYASAVDPRVHFGLGPNARIERLEVRWPDGHLQTLHPTTTNQYLTITEDRPKQAKP